MRQLRRVARAFPIAWDARRGHGHEERRELSDSRKCPRQDEGRASDARCQETPYSPQARTLRVAERVASIVARGAN
jgi:hypothetical protein